MLHARIALRRKGRLRHLLARSRTKSAPALQPGRCGLAGAALATEAIKPYAARSSQAPGATLERICFVGACQRVSARRRMPCACARQAWATGRVPSSVCDLAPHRLEGRGVGKARKGHNEHLRWRLHKACVSWPPVVTCPLITIGGTKDKGWGLLDSNLKRHGKEQICHSRDIENECLSMWRLAV